MPEVPEVAITAQYLNYKLNNKYLTNINVLDGRYKSNGIPGHTDIMSLLPAKFIKVDSKGKFMWFELKSNDTTIYMLVTFGLTGKWIYDIEYKISVAVEFDIKDNTQTSKLYFSNQCGYGTIDITTDKTVLTNKLNSLGDDLLKSTYSYVDIISKFKRMKGNKKIIDVLMDQKTSGIGAGIGNYLSAEILYGAKISPFQPIKDLQASEIERLVDSIKYVIKYSYSKTDLPFLQLYCSYLININAFNDYLSDVKLNTNDLYHYNVYKQKNDPFGNIVKIDINKSRKIYWVPSIIVRSDII